MTFASRFAIAALVLAGGAVAMAGDAHAVGQTPVAVPEPTTLGLIAGGAVVAVVVARFRKRK